MAKRKAKVKHTDILKNMKQNQYLPVYCLHGEESYYIDLITNYIEQNALDESERSFNQITLYGKEIDYKQVLDNARRFPIMAEKQVVIIKEAQEFKTIDLLSTYLEKPLDSTILVLAYKNKKIDSRKKYAKALKKAEKAGKAVIFESSRLYENQIPDWINQYLKDKKYTIDPRASRLLSEYLGNDLAKISNELDKLMINLPEGSKIDNKIIQKNIGISKDFNVFELQNALGRKDHVKANLIVNYFIANPKSGPIPMITATLYNFFSKIYICKFLPNLNDNTVAEAIKINRFFVKDYRIAATSYKRYEVEKILHLLRTYDMRSKGVWIKMPYDQFNERTTHGELLKELVYQILN
ncbi:MAG: DNA polymerase III subunit delta [Saprospiraceae bacterium]|nr:DNA polymerase III subunit delta [Saprospiraceae bacterium]